MLKTKEDRVKEGIRLLKRLKETGVPTLNPGFKQIQEAISVWVVNGEAYTATIPIVRYDRDAVLTLPAEATQTAQIVLKKVEQ